MSVCFRSCALDVAVEAHHDEEFCIYDRATRSVYRKVSNFVTVLCKRQCVASAKTAYGKVAVGVCLRDDIAADRYVYSVYACHVAADFYRACHAVGCDKRKFARAAYLVVTAKGVSAKA